MTARPLYTLTDRRETYSDSSEVKREYREDNIKADPSLHGYPGSSEQVYSSSARRISPLTELIPAQDADSVIDAPPQKTRLSRALTLQLFPTGTRGVATFHLKVKTLRAKSTTSWTTGVESASSTTIWTCSFSPGDGALRSESTRRRRR